MGPDRPNNLWDPVDGEGGVDHDARGQFDDRAHGTSPELWVSHHARAVMAAAGVAVGRAGAWVGTRLARR